MSRLRVVLFSGGRGSQALSRLLASNPHVDLTLAVNGYDDGKSTGEVRRFLGDSLGPSDFRKNAATLAGTLGCCPGELIALLDYRLPDGCPVDVAEAVLRQVAPGAPAPVDDAEREVAELAGALSKDVREDVAARLHRFERERATTGRPFSFSDCAIGNLVFAGGYLEVGRDFNAAIASYAALLGVPPGAIQNVTDGADAHLVALDRQGRLLAREADIVDATRRNFIREIFLVDADLAGEAPRLAEVGDDAVRAELQGRSVAPRLNPELAARLESADLIVYAPGTQHSSLLPSYLTPGLGLAIARNPKAVKLLVTNLQEDAEIPDSSAVEIIQRALYYLTEKDRRPIPAPFLITHYLLNDPEGSETESPYVPLGSLQSIEDPRLVRIANYEEGGSGRHNAQKVLAPFVEALLDRRPSRKVAVLLLDTTSLDKVAQTLLEAHRAGLAELPVELTCYYAAARDLDAEVARGLPFRVENVRRDGEAPSVSLLRAAREGDFDYVVLFESSGMYRGEDVVNLLSLLQGGRLDAVWGSRRLSVKDIRESYRFRYRRSPVLGAISYIGSYALSLVYLLLYGRYVADTLSGARAIRAGYLRGDEIDLADKALNQHLLSRLFRARAEMFETPVQFFSLSPDRANRTTVGDGVRSLAAVVRGRLRSA